MLMSLLSFNTQMHISVHSYLSGSNPKILTRDGFSKLLEKETARRIGDREIDLIFEIFDVTCDGLIGEQELADALQHAKEGMFHENAALGPNLTSNK